MAKVGRRGAQGQTGARGQRGKRGKRGPQGSPGRRGKIGPPGSRGAKGIGGPAQRDRALEVVEEQFNDVYRQLDIQMRRIAQMQVQIDQLLTKVDLLTKRSA